MSSLRIIGPASIEVWISSPVRSRKPVLMNTTRSRAARMQAARLTVVRRSSSMMPILSVLRGRPSRSSTRREQLVGERDFLRPVHLRLDDVDRAGAAVAQRSPAPCRSCIAISDGDRGVEDPLRHLGLPSRPGHRVGDHVVADIAHQHQAAAGQGDGAAVGRGVACGPGCSRALDVLAALLEAAPPACPSSGRASCGRPRPCPRHRPRRRCPRSP